MHVIWNKCTGDSWCSLLNVNLAHAHFEGLEGVYIIWHAGQRPATVYIGQGVIRDRIQAHRSEDAVLAYSAHGLFVTWARVDRASLDGVERFLADTLNPKVGTHRPQAVPIAVNLPW